MSYHKTVFEPYPNPKNSPLGPQIVKIDPKIMSKSKVRIEESMEIKRCFWLRNAGMGYGAIGYGAMSYVPFWKWGHRSHQNELTQMSSLRSPANRKLRSPANGKLRSPARGVWAQECRKGHAFGSGMQEWAMGLWAMVVVSICPHLEVRSPSSPKWAHPDELTEITCQWEIEITCQWEIEITCKWGHWAHQNELTQMSSLRSPANRKLRSLANRKLRSPANG